MAFFEDLGKKITQTSQEVMQKTKDFTDVAKLNSALSDEESRVNNIYCQIGQLYASLHGQDNDVEFIELLTELNDANKKIENIKQEIQDIKGVKRCNICGAEIQKNSAFCSSCGSAVPQEIKLSYEGYNTCLCCGNKIAEDVRFCTFCGTPVQANANILANEEAVLLSEEKVNEKICSTCGTKIEADALFCVNCGTKIN